MAKLGDLGAPLLGVSLGHATELAGVYVKSKRPDGKIFGMDAQAVTVYGAGLAAVAAGLYATGLGKPMRDTLVLAGLTAVSGRLIRQAAASFAPAQFPGVSRARYAPVMNTSMIAQSPRFPGSDLDVRVDR